MILPASSLQAAEEALFSRGIKARDLMEEAGAELARFVNSLSTRPGRILVFCGKGNNAGDACVAARDLIGLGWEVAMRMSFPETQWSELLRANYQKLDGQTRCAEAFLEDAGPFWILDGLLGVAAKGGLRNGLAEAAKDIHRLRRERGARVVSIDLPSGLSEEGLIGVEADWTATICVAKTALIADASTKAVGRLALLPLPVLAAEAKNPQFAQQALPNAECFFVNEQICPLPRRNFEMHKNQCGRLVILAGSEGMAGAAALAAEAGLRGGAGLVHLLTADATAALVAAQHAPREVMTQVCPDLEKILRMQPTAMAVGPGLGRGQDSMLRELVRDAGCPMVLDADALNALALSGSAAKILQDAAAPRLLTPHPGEMERLMPKAGRSRMEWAEALSKESGAVVLLKGARTVVAAPDGRIRFNTSGSPGMASGGMGDVLTGLIGALLAQGVEIFEAACAGAWIAGRSAELCIRDGRANEESLAAGDLPAWFGAAIEDWRAGTW